MSDPNLATFTDHVAVDEHNNRVGKVTDVIYDEKYPEPRWAVVRTGLLTGEHLAPMDGAYVADNGVVVLPTDRASIKSAPKPPRSHILDHEVEEEAVRHFEIEP